MKTAIVTLMLALGTLGIVGCANVPNAEQARSREFDSQNLARAIDLADTAKSACRSAASDQHDHSLSANRDKNVSVLHLLDERYSMQLADCQREYEDALQAAKLLHGAR
jgi:uncharacterized lipoprotein NlpE involved in copper resistance